MYQTKNRIYLNFDKTQKNAVCNNIRALVKQNLDKTCSEILDKFVDDETYYLKLHSSRFPFLEECINDAEFLKETLEYIEACFKYYTYKESQKPFIEKQKQFEKSKRKFLQEVKMSKSAPTKKQLYYYDKLCKRYNLNKQDVNTLSKLDLRNEIERIINEFSISNTNND